MQAYHLIYLFQMIIFAVHNVLTEKDSPHGYLLLCCTRAYLDMIMYENLEVQTSATISAGRKAITRFGQLFTVSLLLSSIYFVYKVQVIQEYIAIVSSEDPDFSKNLDFPKHHAQAHVFDCIEAKGVLRNYTSRLFEGMHPGLKKSYLYHTNFKNVEPQVCYSETCNIR